MAKQEIDTRQFCPALSDQELAKVHHPNHFTISIDTQIVTEKAQYCPVGDDHVSVEVIDDRMIKKMGNIEVSCDGCEHQPEGFTETTLRKIA